MSIRIICTKKSRGKHADPHHAIERLEWIEDGTNKIGNNTRLEIYDWIKNKRGLAYVQDARGNTATVGTREHANGTKFVQTYADGIFTDKLLSLPECRCAGT